MESTGRDEGRFHSVETGMAGVSSRRRQILAGLTSAECTGESAARSTPRIGSVRPGPVGIRVPRARLTIADGKTSEWKSKTLVTGDAIRITPRHESRNSPTQYI